VSTHSHIVSGRRAQRGFSLVTTLLFMIAALLLGVSVMSVNVMQERMIGNTKDRDLAFQAAEAALRDAELDVANNIVDTSAFADNCADGLCTPPSRRASASPLPVDAAQDFWGTPGSAPANVREYGTRTGVRPFPSVAYQPRYVIENLGVLSSLTESIKLPPDPGTTITGYRITARATGARPETVVVLQSIYAKR
jgi:type IV pilus assembly protein PilX